ncbi:hypothetical protein V6N13_078559 [Hibiscus sabdariffa]
MESNKFALILVAMAVVLLAAMAPTARNEVTPSAITTTTNTDTFLVYKPVENCKPVGASCRDPSECCSGICLYPINFPVPTSGTCFR